MMRDFLLILSAAACVALAVWMAYIERGYFAIGIEPVTAFIPLGIKYIWEH